MDEYLTQLYYNPKRSGSFGGVERLYRDVKKEGKYDISRAQLKKNKIRTRYTNRHVAITREIALLLGVLMNYGRWI